MALTELALVPLLLVVASVAEVTRHEISAKVGSSVLIPGVNVTIDNDIILDLKMPGRDPDWLASYHGGLQLNGHYQNRGEYFYQNGSFLLRNVTESDSRVYVQECNHTKMVEINLKVIAPALKPLLRQHPPNNQCQVNLTCDGSRGCPMNVSIWRNGKEINENVTRNDSITILSLNVKDPQSWGYYTCVMENPVSREMSDGIMVQNPVPELMVIGFYMSNVALALVLPSLCVLIWLFVTKKIGDPQQSDGAFLQIILGIGTDLAASLSLLYFWDSSRVPLCFGLIYFFSLQLVRFCSWKEVIDIKSLKAVLGWILNLSDYLVVPGISVAVMGLFYTHNNTPCGRTIFSHWYFYFSIVLPLVVSSVVCFDVCRRFKKTSRNNNNDASAHYLLVISADDLELGKKTGDKAMVLDLESKYQPALEAVQLKCDENLLTSGEKTMVLDPDKVNQSALEATQLKSDKSDLTTEDDASVGGIHEDSLEPAWVDNDLGESGTFSGGGAAAVY
ncbi:uncharacterized protein O3C94_004478 [Discoglossus pictus]